MNVAVIIPCYNMASTLDETLASVRAQTQQAAEVVVVDDGSDVPVRTDHARVIRLPQRSGVARARAEGVRQTTSPLLVLLDADDRLAPRFIERTTAHLDGADFVATAYELFGDVAGRVTPPPPDAFIRHFCEGSYAITALLRRQVWENVGGCDETLEAAEDWAFWLAVLAAKHRGVLLDEALFHYRIHAGSRDPRGLRRDAYLRTLRDVARTHREVLQANSDELLKLKRENLARVQDDEARLQAGLGALAQQDRRAVILCYHRVAALDPDRFSLCVSPALFNEHMQHIARRCTPLSLTALWRHMDEGSLPERAVAVTLDDGYLDAFAASEILQAQQVPATFYVNTDRIAEPHEAWQEVLERIFLSQDPVPPGLRLSVGDTPIAIPTLGQPARRAAFDVLYYLGRCASERGRRELIDTVATWSGLSLPPRDSHRLLTSSELVTLASRPGHDIGSHSAHHLLLPAQPRHVQRFEIESSKHALEQIIGRPVTSFAYPYGELSPTTVELARLAGFQSAVSTAYGVLTPYADPMQAPRIEVGAWSTAELARRLDDLFA